MRTQLDDFEEDGGLRRNNRNSRRRGRSNGHRYGDQFERPSKSTASPFHSARDLVRRARLDSNTESEFLAKISGAGNNELQRLLDTGELQEEIKQALQSA